MIEISFEEVMAIHDKTIKEEGGLAGIRDQGALESALAQPYSGFGDYEAYPNLEDKAAALCFSIVKNHPFLDGNKRTGFQAMNVFLMKAGYHLVVSPDEGDQYIRSLAAGDVSREELAIWIVGHAELLEEVTPTVTEGFETPSSFGEVTPISNKAQQIEKERPYYWKPKMLAQILLDEIGKFEEEREEHRLGFSSKPRFTFPMADFFSWISSEMKKRAPIIESQGKVINFLGNEAFYQSETGGNLDYMISIARELGGIYRDTINWSQQFRQVDMPPAYHPLLTKLGSYFDNFIHSIEQLPIVLLSELEKAEAASGDEPYRITLVIDFAPNEVDLMTSELKDLERALGLVDENGLNSADYVTAALNKSQDIFDAHTQAFEKYLAQYTKWTNALRTVQGRPVHIAKPQSNAIFMELAKTIIELAHQIKPTFPAFKSIVETLETHGPYLGNFVDPMDADSRAEAIDALNSLEHLHTLAESATASMSGLQVSIEAVQSFSSRIHIASKTLLLLHEELTALYEKFSQACLVSAQALRTKLN